jgi:hypothetical protein
MSTAPRRGGVQLGISQQLHRTSNQAQGSSPCGTPSGNCSWIAA